MAASNSTHCMLSSEVLYRFEPLKKQDIPRLYDTVCNIVTQRGRNDMPFGKDEFPSLEVLEYQLAQSHILVATDMDSVDTWQAFTIFTPSVLCSGDTYTCDMYPAVIDGQASAGLYRDLIKAMVPVCLELGYQTCIFHTFATNRMAIDQFWAEGFIQVARIPKSGIVQDKGTVDTVALYKSLILPGSYRTTRIFPGRKKLLAPMPQDILTSAIPCKLPPPACIDATVRYMEDKDVETVHCLFQDAYKRGLGYGRGEVPSLEDFRQDYLDRSHYHSMVIVDNMVGHILGAMCYSPTPNCRTYYCTLLNSVIVISAEARGKGIGKSVAQHINELMARGLGYSHILLDAYADNDGILGSLPVEYTVVGCIPDSGVVRGKGTVAAYLIFKPLEAKYDHAQLNYSS